MSARRYARYGATKVASEDLENQSVWSEQNGPNDNEDEEKLDYPFAGDRNEVFDEDKEAVPMDDDIISALTGDADTVGGKTRWSGATGKSGKSYKSAYADDFPQPGADIACPVSPRTKFIAGCVRERMNPRASLILRKRLGKDVNISHMCIGNDVARLLADCLSDMPFIESINFNNNNLTDEGVASILEACQPISTLKKLDISRNKMDDDAADALADYVQMEDCPLESLVMQVSDVDAVPQRWSGACCNTGRGLLGQ